MKKVLTCFIVFVFFLSLLSPKIYAEKSLNWYIKRHPGHCPTFPSEASSLDPYNAYYIDKKLNQCSDKKAIYLTFDAGYENGNIEKLLDVLKEKDVKAAFFLLDNIILKNTDLVLRMGDEGHLVCNHTKNHKNLSFASEKEIADNLKALEVIYKEKCGREMSKYFRFPEGKYSIDSLKTISNLGYKTIFWSFAYEDWDNNNQPNPKYAFKKIIDNTHNGAVFLFHPTSATNLAVFPGLIDEWRKNGYSFGTLDELTK